jgi:hypothetical protein
VIEDIPLWLAEHEVAFLDESGESCREALAFYILWTRLKFRFRHFCLAGLKALAHEKSRQKASCRIVPVIGRSPPKFLELSKILTIKHPERRRCKTF